MQNGSHKNLDHIPSNTLTRSRFDIHIVFFPIRIIILKKNTVKFEH